jgi:hypothetical protein
MGMTPKQGNQTRNLEASTRYCYIMKEKHSLYNIKYSLVSEILCNEVSEIDHNNFNSTLDIEINMKPIM